MSNKIFITGVHGLLGRTLVEQIQQKYDLVASDLSGTAKDIVPETKYRPLDITDYPTVKMELAEQQPDVIIHCAAMTNVDDCEDNPNKAMNTNGKALEPIVEYCIESNAFLVYISSDYVFDGKKGDYCETDETHAISAYGRSKLYGEEIIKQSECNFAIVRPNTLYGYQRDVNLNFVTWVIRQFQFQVPMRIVTDQVSNPSDVLDLTNLILTIFDQEKTGIFHHGSINSLSRFDFVNEIAEVFDSDKTLVTAITLSDFQQRATRPEKSWLNLENTIASVDWMPRTTRNSLKILKERMKYCGAL